MHNESFGIWGLKLRNYLSRLPIPGSALNRKATLSSMPEYKAGLVFVNHPKPALDSRTTSCSYRLMTGAAQYENGRSE